MKSNGRIQLSFLMACAFLLLSAATLRAQGERGAFNGIVTDTSGAVVPNAEIIALNLGTNVETKTSTTDAGVYRLPYLPLGTYKLTVKANGFQTAVADNVTLRVAQTLTLDFKQQVGQVSEQVTVTSAAPLIESGTAEISRYVTNEEFDTLPLLIGGGGGRRIIQSFVFSSLPGTVGTTFQGSINGGQLYSHEILIEGIPVGGFDLQGGGDLNPSFEAVSEFKLQTGTIGAQYGGGQTGVVNFAIKSGANELHGSGFSYLQNDVLRANSPFNNAINRPKPPFKLLNYGYSVGGPVYIPKVYNGKNKTFFFNNLEVGRVRNFVSTSFTTLPTVAFKRGDFSQLLNPAFTGNASSGTTLGTDAVGRPIVFGQLYDPRTTRTVNGVTVRDPFPGNIIPQSIWSPVTGKILELAPITDPINSNLLNNIPAIGTCCPRHDDRNHGFKVDHKFSDQHRLATFYNHNYRVQDNSPGNRWGIPPGTPTGVYQRQSTPGRMVRIAEDWTITPAVLNHFAIGYNRFGSTNQSAFIDQGWPEKIGLQNVAPTHFPVLTFGGTAIQGGGIGAGGRLGSGSRFGGYNGSTIVQDDLTIIRGKHNFKTGMEVRKYYFNNRNKSGSGDFNFQPIQTELPGFSSSTGHSFASFLLGAVNNTGREINSTTFGYRVTQPGFYFMDDWKVNRKLTLNLGVRWEVIGGYNEVAGRITGIDLTKPNPGAGGRPGALVFVDDLGKEGFQDTYWWMVSPRFGFAYAVNDKLVVRGGYGINNTPHITNGFNFPGTSGFSGSISINSNNTPLRFPQDPVLYLHDRYPDFPGALPNKNPALQNGQGIPYTAPDSNRVGYVQNYNLGFQYALPASFVLEAGYIGNKGTRLVASSFSQLDQLPVSALALGDRLIEPLSANPGLAPIPYAGFNGTVAQALRGFPQYNGVFQFYTNFGTSHYDSLQLQLTRRFTNGLSVLAAYTWSKALFNGSDGALGSFLDSQDVFNRQLEKSPTSFSIPQFLKVSWIYELPFGKGKPVNVTGALGHIVGGWTVTGIHNYRSGDPLSISTSAFRTAIFNGTFRPDVVPGVPMKLNSSADVQTNGSGERYLNPAAFAQIPRTGNNIPLRLGTAAPRYQELRGPYNLSESFGLRKGFAFTESSRVEFAAVFGNAFNRAGRGNPNTDITSPLFGKITGFQQPFSRNVQLEMRVTF
ncbi:MAG: TonB-dependent receptor [Acidobacteria bacterium]|nr:TonB-dependent receptor [Acidobacteriota bacterium]